MSQNTQGLLSDEEALIRSEELHGSGFTNMCGGNGTCPFLKKKVSGDKTSFLLATSHSKEILELSLDDFKTLKEWFEKNDVSSL